METLMELTARYLERLPDETREWLEASDLWEDPTTLAVVDPLETAAIAYERQLGPEVEFALEAGMLHRAPVIASGPNGESPGDYADIPGDLDSMTLEILRGHESGSAVDEHCSSFETTVAACILNMATRWADGEESYQWTEETIRRVCEFGAHKKLSALREIERSVLDT